MGLLLLQVAPVVSRHAHKTKTKSGKSGYEESTTVEDEESTTVEDEESTTVEDEEEEATEAAVANTGVSINVIDLTNFLVQGLFDYMIGILSAIGICIPLCVDAVDCINCFALALPPPPAVPASIIESGSATV